MTFKILAPSFPHSSAPQKGGVFCVFFFFFLFFCASPLNLWNDGCTHSSHVLYLPFGASPSAHPHPEKSMMSLEWQGLEAEAATRLVTHQGQQLLTSEKVYREILHISAGMDLTKPHDLMRNLPQNIISSIPCWSWAEEKHKLTERMILHVFQWFPSF